MSAEIDSCFVIIPPELKFKLFEFLNFNERKVLRLVCISWCNIINQSLKFRAVLNDKTRDWIETSTYELASLTVQHLSEVLPLSSFQVEGIPRVKKFILGPENNRENVKNFLTRYCNCCEINSLEIRNLALANVEESELLKLNWPQTISTLILTDGSKGVNPQNAEGYEIHTRNVATFLQSVHLQTLKKLRVRLINVERILITSASGKRIQFLKPLMNTLNFILKHGSTLEELELELTGKPEPKKQISLYASVFRDLSTLKLRKYSLGVDDTNKNFGLLLSGVFSGLREMKIHEILKPGQVRLQARAFNPAKILYQNITCLQILTCEMDEFHMTWLLGFINLEVLELKLYVNIFDLLFTDPLIRNNFPRLRKFKIETLFMFGDLVEEVEAQMPYLEEMELIIGSNSEFVLQPRHLTSLKKNLHKLRKIIFDIGQGRVRKFQDYVAGDNDLKFKIEDKGFICGKVEIKRAHC